MTDRERRPVFFGTPFLLTNMEKAAKISPNKGDDGKKAERFPLQRAGGWCEPAGRASADTGPGAVRLSRHVRPGRVTTLQVKALLEAVSVCRVTGDGIQGGTTRQRP